MADAAFTPRVRVMVVCEDVTASEIENGVFDLAGVRQHLEADSFPWSCQLNLFLVLSNPRKGTYQGTILVVNDQTDRVIRYARFPARFEEDNEILPVSVEIAPCEFPEPGQYSFQIWFSAGGNRGDVQKGEQPFHVLEKEE